MSDQALTKAINIVVGRPIFGDTAVGVEARLGGRLFFFVPWRGGTMIGTLYLPHDGPGRGVRGDGARSGD